ncbi:MAG: hypothetical protein ABR968_07475 [Bacteroidales bacterium]|jgi:hypothetical protein
MKKNLLIFTLLIFLFGVVPLFGQNSKIDTVIKRSPTINNIKPILSAEISGLFPYPCDKFDDKRGFNHGFAGLISCQFSRIKLSIGFDYYTLFYTENDYDPLLKYNPIIKTVYTTSYYDIIPLEISFSLFNKDFLKNNDLIIGAGSIVDCPDRFKATIFYQNPNSSSSTSFSPGIEGIDAIQLSLCYKRKINRTFDAFIRGTYYHKFIQTDYYVSGTPISGGPVFFIPAYFIEINVGIEAYFNR